MNAPQALILGGTSFFGKEIARQFHEAGYRVSLFTRGNQLPSDLPPHRHIRGDRNNAEDLHRAGQAERWDVVVDNIAYDATQVAAAMAAFSRAKRYLLCSTVSVYRYVNRPAPQPLLESYVDYGFKPAAENLEDVHWKYARGKLEAERVLVEKATVPWTILRPPVVYGPHDVTDRGFWYLGRLIQGGPILLASDGAQSFRLVYSRDIARSFLLAAQSQAAVGKTYNIAQAEVITLKQFIEDSARALGTSAELVSAPSEFLGDLGGPYSAAIMTNLIPDISAAVRDLGFQPTPWPDFCERTARWFQNEWTGNMEKLCGTRREELELAKAWREATARLRPV